MRFGVTNRKQNFFLTLKRKNCVIEDSSARAGDECSIVLRVMRKLREFGILHCLDFFKNDYVCFCVFLILHVGYFLVHAKKRTLKFCLMSTKMLLINEVFKKLYIMSVILSLQYREIDC